MTICDTPLEYVSGSVIIYVESILSHAEKLESNEGQHTSRILVIIARLINALDDLKKSLT